MTKKERLEAEKQEARERLLEWLKPGDTVYTILDHVSGSGMTRHIRLVLMESNDEGRVIDTHPNYSVAKLLGYRQAKRDGLIVSGCGMDMGFAVVYELSHALFPDGFGCIGKGCPSNDHSNGDRDYTPHDEDAPDTNSNLASGVDRMKAREQAEHTGKRHHWHNSGGYALRQRWL